MGMKITKVINNITNVFADRFTIVLNGTAVEGIYFSHSKKKNHGNTQQTTIKIAK